MLICCILNINAVLVVHVPNGFKFGKRDWENFDSFPNIHDVVAHFTDFWLISLEILKYHKGRAFFNESYLREKLMTWNLQKSCAKIKVNIKKPYKNYENLHKIHCSWQVFNHEWLQSTETVQMFSPDADLCKSRIKISFLELLSWYK